MNSLILLTALVVPGDMPEDIANVPPGLEHLDPQILLELQKPL